MTKIWNVTEQMVVSWIQDRDELADVVADIAMKRYSVDQLYEDIVVSVGDDYDEDGMLLTGEEE